jgi:hypothetical protein
VATLSEFLESELFGRAPRNENEKNANANGNQNATDNEEIADDLAGRIAALDEAAVAARIAAKFDKWVRG